MLVVETIAKIRRAYFVQGKPIKAICRELKVSRKVVRKVLRSRRDGVPLRARRCSRCRRSVRGRTSWSGCWRRTRRKPARERLTLIRIFEELRGLGYEGGYDAVRRYARSWQRERQAATADAYVPLSFAPGEAYQFDWSHEIVLINGVTVTVKVAHVRLCHSRMLFVRAYPRETQEMVFDAHDRAFAFFKGACTRGIYDNMKTAVETVFVGKERAYNRRFLQMCGHYLVEPVACTPASGWEKGQVENQVGLVRERFFTPRLRFKSYEELNAWLLDRCVAYAKAHRHPELRGPDGLGGVRGGAAEPGALCRPLRRLPRGAGLGLEDLPGALRQQQILGRGERRRPAGRDPGLCRSHRASARTARSSASIAAASAATRRSTIPGTTCRCWPASPARCGTARRSRTGCCRPALERVRRKLAGADDGDRQMVDDPDRRAERRARRGRGGLRRGARARASTPPTSSSTSWPAAASPAPPITILTPDALRLRHEPVGRLRPLRQPQEGKLMERSEILDRHGRAEALRHEGGLRRDHRPPP